MKKSLLILLLTILPAIAWLIQPGFFPMHDDLQPMRQMQLEKCFKDWQIPCRWVPDMGYEYGYPLFNYYPPFPYYLGEIFRIFSFSFTNVVKIVGVLGFLAAATSMYFLGREFFGETGGIISSLFYTYSPYHSVDYYVRGAVNEFWSQAFFPLVFLFSYKLVTDKSYNKWIPLLSLSVAGIMLTHNPSLMIFVPGFMLWVFFWIIKSKNFKSIISLAISAAWALGLAAFFTLPVLLETKYVSVWTLTSGYFNYLAHFLDLNQIFFRINWDYGSSIYGPNDTMSLAIGYMQWIVPSFLMALSLFVPKLRKLFWMTLLLFGLGVISIFMTHSKATPIWIILKPLEYLQFPWRFLTLVIFYFSFISGAIVFVLPKGSLPAKALASAGLTLLLLLNANYFRPRDWWPTYGDTDRFTGNNWQRMLTSSIFDYLPIWAPLPPADQALEDIKFVTGMGSYSTLVKKTNRQEYSLTISTASATTELQTYYFPGWKIWMDGKEVKIDPYRDKVLGRMQVDLSSGKHTILARFANTPIRTVSNALSLIAWTGIILYFAKRKWV